MSLDLNELKINKNKIKEPKPLRTNSRQRSTSFAPPVLDLIDEIISKKPNYTKYDTGLTHVVSNAILNEAKRLKIKVKPNTEIYITSIRTAKR